MKIILDPYKVFQPGKNTFAVNSEAAYASSRKAIIRYQLSGNLDFEVIYVSDRPYNKWYNDLPDLVEIVSPRSLLIEKFPSAILPDSLSEDDVIQLNLLDTAAEPTEKEIMKLFINIVLPQKIDAGRQFSLAYTLSQTVVTCKKAFKQRFIAATWQEKLCKALAAETEDSRRIFQPIIDLDERYCGLLVAGLYGSKNEAFKKYWLEDVALEFHNRSVPIESIEKLLSGGNNLLPVNEKIETNLERFFEENLRAGKFGITELSGQYQAELNALITIGKKFDQTTLAILQEKFSNVSTERQRNDLNKLRLPELEDFPILKDFSIAEQAARLKTWAVNSFIPYKFYFDEAKAPEAKALEHIEQQACQFGDWLFDNIAGILNEDDIYTNIDIVKSIRDQVKNGASMIWLVIDGLAAYYTGLLETILKENGINHLQTSWSFATLPTITEVAVPVTISGKFASDISDTEFPQRKELLAKAFPEKATVYSSQPANFQAVLNQPFDVCCLHVHEIDKEMHKNDWEFYNGRTVEIEHHLNKYITMVAETMRKNPDRTIKLLISTDHGTTKCLTNAQMIKNPKLNELAQSRPRERCIPLTEALARQNWEQSDLYMLKKTVSRNRYDWAIARGYKYFGKNDTGYRHGGLTPEEVVVPVISGQILQKDTIKLLVRPIGLQEFRFGKTEKNFKFRIKNADLNSILLVAVAILEEKDTSFDLPLQIPAYGEIDLTGMIKLHPRLKSKVKNGLIQLNFALKYNLLGTQYEDVLTIEVFTEKDEFETDF